MSKTAEENRRIVERFINELILGGNLEVMDELCHPDLVNHAAAPGNQNGLDGIRKVIGFSLSAMPDQRWTDQVVVADDEYVVVRAIRKSTWQADSFRGVPTPSGKPIAVEMVHIWRISEGRIAEHWAVRDDLGMMQQLGALESPG